jgi:hypothetical protein
MSIDRKITLVALAVAGIVLGALAYTGMAGAVASGMWGVVSQNLALSAMSGVLVLLVSSAFGCLLYGFGSDARMSGRTKRHRLMP